MSSKSPCKILVQIHPLGIKVNLAPMMRRKFRTQTQILIYGAIQITMICLWTMKNHRRKKTKCRQVLISLQKTTQKFLQMSQTNQKRQSKNQNKKFQIWISIQSYSLALNSQKILLGTQISYGSRFLFLLPTEKTYHLTKWWTRLLAILIKFKEKLRDSTQLCCLASLREYFYCSWVLQEFVGGTNKTNKRLSTSANSKIKSLQEMMTSFLCPKISKKWLENQKFKKKCVNQDQIS